MPHIRDGLAMAERLLKKKTSKVLSNKAPTVMPKDAIIVRTHKEKWLVWIMCYSVHNYLVDGGDRNDLPMAA